MPAALDLGRLFAAAAAALAGQRQRLNQADPINHNHGDNMVAAFEAVAGLVDSGQAGNDLSGALAAAAAALRGLPDNGSAQMYAHGLASLAEQTRRRGVSLDDLTRYAHGALKPPEAAAEPLPEAPAGASPADVLKALLGGLAGWERLAGTAGDAQPSADGMDLGYLFGLGAAYLQAKQRNPDRLDALVDAVVTASPLGKTPHRLESGRLALRALLQALADRPGS